MPSLATVVALALALGACLGLRVAHTTPRPDLMWARLRVEDVPPAAAPALAAALAGCGLRPPWWDGVARQFGGARWYVGWVSDAREPAVKARALAAASAATGPRAQVDYVARGGPRGETSFAHTLAPGRPVVVRF